MEWDQARPVEIMKPTGRGWTALGICAGVWALWRPFRARTVAKNLATTAGTTRKKMLVAAITGHRPEKIPDEDWVVQALEASFAALEVNKIIVGMAAGVDLIAARVAHNLGMEYVCARPWAGHKPRRGWEHYYDSALRNSTEAVDVDMSLDYPGPWVYQVRNKWMVDHANFLISVWDGSEGGTANCIIYAKKMGIVVWNCNPETRECGFVV